MTWPTFRAFRFSPSHTPLDLHHLIKTYDRVLFFLHQNDPCLHWTWIQTETRDSFTVGRQHNAFLQGGRIFSLPRDVFLRSWDHLMGRAQCRTVWPNHIHWGVILVWLKASLFLFNHFVSATASTYLDEDKTRPTAERRTSARTLREHPHNYVLLLWKISHSFCCGLFPFPTRPSGLISLPSGSRSWSRSACRNDCASQVNAQLVVQSTKN